MMLSRHFPVRIQSGQQLQVWLALCAQWSRLPEQKVPADFAHPLLALACWPQPDIDSLLQPLALLVLGNRLRSINSSELRKSGPQGDLRQRRWALIQLDHLPADSEPFLHLCASEPGRRTLLLGYLMGQLNPCHASRSTGPLQSPSEQFIALGRSLADIIGVDSSAAPDPLRVYLPDTAWSSLIRLGLDTSGNNDQEADVREFAVHPGNLHASPVKTNRPVRADSLADIDRVRA